MAQTHVKDPNEVLDYKFDWDTNYLETGETISSATVIVESGITKDSDAITDSDRTVTVWLSGGTADNEYTVTCQIVTSLSRTAERSMFIRVLER
jgi:hypothetical protein